MGKKDNLPLGVRLEFDDIDYWQKLSRKKTITLPNGQKISEYEYMKKFMHEAYGNNFSRKDSAKNILQTEDQKKWARRNNNNTNRDALLVSKKAGMLNSLMQITKHDYRETTESWETLFKNSTYEASLTELLKTTCINLKIQYNKSTAKQLMIFFFRIKRFLKLVRADMKTKEEQ